MALEKITENMGGQESADVVYNNDQFVLGQSVTKEAFKPYAGILGPVLTSKWYYFNGATSEINLPASITLQANGDYIEFNAVFYNETGVTYPGLGAFGRRLNGYGGIGHQSFTPVVRDTTNGNWIIPRSGGASVLPIGQPVKLRYAWESGVVVIYLNGEEIRRSSAQGVVEINNIGMAYITTNPANMALNNVYIVAGGVIYDLSNLMEAGVSTDVSLQDPKNQGFLTDEQLGRLIPEGVNFTEQGGYTGTAKALYDRINALTAGKIWYTYYNGTDAYTLLGKTYTLDAVGDWFEIRFRFPNWDYMRELSLLGFDGGTANFFSSASSGLGLTIRDNSGNWCYLGPVLSSGELGAWNTARVDIVEGGNFQLTLNGTTYPPVTRTDVFKINCIGRAYLSSYALCDVEYLTIHAAEGGDFHIADLATFPNSINTEDRIEGEGPDEQENLPTCVVDYKLNYNNTGRKNFIIYTRYANSSYYIGFNLTHEFSSIPIYYTNQHRITSGNLYRYSGGNFVSMGTVILTTGESECVFQQIGGGPVDHTGGTHGDEQLIDVKFYIDGVLLTEEDLAEAFLRPCDKFQYVQKSSLHKTGTRKNVDTGLTASGEGVLTVNNDTKNFVIDGVSTGVTAYSANSYITADDLAKVTLSKSGTNTWVLNNVIQPYEDHPLVAYHWKQTTFRTGGYDTKNRIQWKEALNNYIYCGIVCVNRTNGKYVYSETLDDFIETNGDGGHKLDYPDSLIKEINFTNPDTGLAALVTSRFVNSPLDDTGGVFVWDAGPTLYTKYYRRNATRTPEVDEMYIMECNVTFFKE